MQGMSFGEIEVTKTVTDLNGGALEPGDELEYAVVLGNVGSADQPDNRGKEFKDNVPRKKTRLLSAEATSGKVVVKRAKNLVEWHGPIPAGGQVTITIRAQVKARARRKVCNRAFAYYDADLSGNNETRVPSDDPRTAEVRDKTCVRIGEVVVLPNQAPTVATEASPTEGAVPLTLTLISCPEPTPPTSRWPTTTAPPRRLT
jgi:hypothetical protein